MTRSAEWPTFSIPPPPQLLGGQWHLIWLAVVQRHLRTVQSDLLQKSTSTHQHLFCPQTSMKLLKFCNQKKSNTLIFIDVFAAPVMNESLLWCSTESSEKLWICYSSLPWFVIKLPTEGYPANYDYTYSHLPLLTNYAHREMFLSFLCACFLAVNTSFECYQGHLLD